MLDYFTSRPTQKSLITKGVNFFEEKNYAFAITCFQDAIALGGNLTASAYINQGLVHLVLGEWAFASSCFMAAKNQRRTASAERRRYAGAVLCEIMQNHLHLRIHPDHEIIIKQLLEFFPESSFIHYVVGYLYHKEGFYTEATTHLNSAFQLYKSYVNDVSDTEIFDHLENGFGKHFDKQIYYLQALNHLAQGKYLQAWMWLRVPYSSFDSLHTLHANRTLVLDNDGVPKVNPTYDWATIERPLFNSDTLDHKQAPDESYLRGLINLRLGLYQVAQMHFQNVTSNVVKNEGQYGHLSLAFYQSAVIEQMQRSDEKSFAQNLSIATAYITKTESHVRPTDHVFSAFALTSASLGHYTTCMLGHIYLHQQKFAAAIECFTKVIKIRDLKYLPLALNGLANAYFQTEQYREAAYLFLGVTRDCHISAALCLEFSQQEQFMGFYLHPFSEKLLAALIEKNFYSAALQISKFVKSMLGLDYSVFTPQEECDLRNWGKKLIEDKQPASGLNKLELAEINAETLRQRKLFPGKEKKLTENPPLRTESKYDTPQSRPIPQLSTISSETTYNGATATRERKGDKIAPSVEPNFDCLRADSSLTSSSSSSSSRTPAITAFYSSELRQRSISRTPASTELSFSLSSPPLISAPTHQKMT